MSVDALRAMSQAELNALLSDPAAAIAWQADRQTYAELELPEMTGGVNPGDQRALYTLIHQLKPQRILETGTHLCCSTVSMWLAARQADIETQVTTVDLRDVNDEAAKPWLDYKAKRSPRQMFAQLQAESQVTFAMGDSREVIEELEGPFDFVFLDGGHEYEVVKAELERVLPKLATKGLVLLHDYFPNAEPIWEGQFHCDGPYRAVETLRSEGYQIKALPLGELPWPTKLGTNFTTLALVVRES
jgi:predicted O-methyltransferase YrrM